MGKNSSGSACRQAPRDIQLRERAPVVTGSTGCNAWDMSAPPGARRNSPPGSGAVRHCDHKTHRGDPGDLGLPFQGNETRGLPAGEPVGDGADNGVSPGARTRTRIRTKEKLHGKGRDHIPGTGQTSAASAGRGGVAVGGPRHSVGSASASVAQIVSLWSRPVMCSSFTTWGRGAARRMTIPHAVARRCVPISTASPATSQNDTPDRSMMSSRTPGPSRSSRRSRSSGTVAISSSPSRLAMVQAGRLRTDRLVQLLGQRHEVAKLPKLHTRRQVRIRDPARSLRPRPGRGRRPGRPARGDRQVIGSGDGARSSCLFPPGCYQG